MIETADREVAWRLGAEEVHLWFADLDRAWTGAAPQRPTVLSDDEWDRAHRVLHPETRRRFIAGRTLLRIILAGYTGEMPQAVAFSYGPFGKPSLAAPGRAGPIHFNLSHSEGVALLAVTGTGEVGVDVERIHAIPDCEDLAAACFPDCDRDRLRSLPEGERDAAFMRCWTRLEAMLKALGWGWTGPSHGIEPCGGAAFSVHEVSPVTGYAAALATSRPGCRIIRRQLGAR